jgi:D-3-phosphoglycerate dehydrogenase
MAQLKEGVFLINCARGGIYDEQALCDALVSGKVAAAGIDVYSSEPPKTERLCQLLALDNVVATPHIGANTVEAQRDVAVQIVQQVIDALRGSTSATWSICPLPRAWTIDRWRHT